MINPFRSKPVSVLCIDISLTAITLLIINPSAKQVAPSIDYFIRQTLPEGCVVDGEIRQPTVVSEQLANLLQTIPLRFKQIFMVLPAALTMQKILSIRTGLSTKALEAIVVMEAEKLLMCPRDEFCFDFHCMDSTSTAIQNILLIACATKHVQGRVAILKTLGLTPSVMDIDSVAFERASYALVGQAHLRHYASIVCVDRQETQLRCCLFNQLKLVHSWCTPLPSQIFASETQRSGCLIQQMLMQTIQQPYDCVLLSGDAHDLKCQQLAAQLQTPVLALDPLQGWPMSKNVNLDMVKQHGAYAMVARGMAQRVLL